MQFIMQKQLSYLNKTQFVSCLSIHQVARLFEKIKDSVKDHYKTYEAGEHLFRAKDDSSAGLFLIKEGDVKVRECSSTHAYFVYDSHKFCSGLFCQC